MTDTGALELIIAVARLHHNRVASHGPLLVLDEELDHNHEIYAAGLRRIGGVYVSVDRMSEPRVRGKLDPVLAAALTESLRVSGLSLEIEIQQEGADVVVQRPRAGSILNDSERIVLAFVASLFSEEFSSHRLGVISWTESRLEIMAREALWLLIRAQVASHPIGTVETLVFIAGGQVDTSLHCEHETSVRYSLGKAGLIKRKSRVSLEAAVSKLVQCSEEEPFVLFLGAGASASAGMPLGNEVRDHALERFFGEKPRPVTELSEQFFQWVRENDRLLASEQTASLADFTQRLTLERVLREEFRRDGRDSSFTLRYLRQKDKQAVLKRKTRFRTALTKLNSKKNRLVIVTVNFDTILEDHFADQIKVFSSAEDFLSAADYIKDYLAGSPALPVLKLHGTLPDAHTIVADIDTRSLGLSSGAAEALRCLLPSDRQTVPWVYIGASMRDPDVTEVLGAPDFAAKLDEWWVSPFPDSAVETFAQAHRIPKWSGAERPGFFERQITETADTFLTVLADQWRGTSKT